jgi:hypothetical protein
MGESCAFLGDSLNISAGRFMCDTSGRWKHSFFVPGAGPRRLRPDKMMCGLKRRNPARPGEPTYGSEPCKYGRKAATSLGRYGGRGWRLSSGRDDWKGREGKVTKKGGKGSCAKDNTFYTNGKWGAFRRQSPFTGRVSPLTRWIESGGRCKSS